MPDATPPTPVNLKPDKVANKLGAHPGIPTGYVSFKGFLGPDVGGLHRIYLDNSHWKWLEVRASDIVHREKVPRNHSDPRSVFWIKRTAEVLTCNVSPAHQIEKELWGVDSDPAEWGRPPW